MADIDGMEIFATADSKTFFEKINDLSNDDVVVQSVCEFASVVMEAVIGAAPEPLPKPEDFRFHFQLIPGTCLTPEGSHSGYRLDMLVQIPRSPDTDAHCFLSTNQNGRIFDLVLEDDMLEWVPSQTLH